MLYISALLNCLYICTVHFSNQTEIKVKPGQDNRFKAREKEIKPRTMASGTYGMSLKISELSEKLENSCIEVEKLREDNDEINSKTLERRKEKIDFEHQVGEKKVQYKTTYLNKKSEKPDPEERRMFFDFFDSYLFYSSYFKY